MFLIAGSSGYVGKSLISLLNSKNEDFYSIHATSDPKTSNNRNFLIKDRNLNTVEKGNAQKISKSLKLLGITEIINLAADTSKDASEVSRKNLIKANFDYNRELIEISISSGIKNFHFISTYSSTNDGIEFLPQTFYAGTKFLAEKLLETYAVCGLINVSIIEVFDIYGPLQPHKRLVNYCLDSLLNNTKICISSGEQEINLINVSDVCLGIYRIAYSQIEDPKPLIHFSLYSDEIFKVRDVPLIIAEYLKIPLTSDQISHSKDSRDREIMLFKPRFKRPENWKETFTLEKGVKQMVQKIPTINEMGQEINV
jgi:nucleoside-diphosphate-sugar epimerase